MVIDVDFSTSSNYYSVNHAVSAGIIGILQVFTSRIILTHEICSLVLFLVLFCFFHIAHTKRNESELFQDNY